MSQRPLHYRALPDGPPPHALYGEDFASAAMRLAGFAGVAFGWTPEAFWRATPAELDALVVAMTGDTPAPLHADALAELRRRYPDG